MRTTQWMISFFLAGSLCTTSAMAADTPASVQKAPVTETSKLDKINAEPAATAHDEKDCPMDHGKKNSQHQAQKECNHKKGEPCPYHQDAKQHGKMQDKCEHKHPG